MPGPEADAGGGEVPGQVPDEPGPIVRGMELLHHAVPRRSPVRRPERAKPVPGRGRGPQDLRGRARDRRAGRAVTPLERGEVGAGLRQKRRTDLRKSRALSLQAEWVFVFQEPHEEMVLPRIAHERLLGELRLSCQQAEQSAERRADPRRLGSSGGEDLDQLTPRPAGRVF